jgi:hypothetical protein
VGDGDRTSSVQADGEKIWVIRNVGGSNQVDITWRAGLEAAWDEMGNPFGSDSTANMCDLGETVFVESDTGSEIGQKRK